jgi:predicted ester cyclase
MSVEQNKVIARRHLEQVWNEQGAAVANDIYLQDYLHRPPNPWEPAFRRRGEGEFEQAVTRMRPTDSGLCFTIEDIIAEGDRVAVRWSLGQPGQPPAATGIVIQHIVDGRVVEDWNVVNDLRL